MLNHSLQNVILVKTIILKEITFKVLIINHFIKLLLNNEFKSL